MAKLKMLALGDELFILLVIFPLFQRFKVKMAHMPKTVAIYLSITVSINLMGFFYFFRDFPK